MDTSKVTWSHHMFLKANAMTYPKPSM